MPRTKKQLEASIARLDARYKRIQERLQALQRESNALNDKRIAIAATQARLRKQLKTPREDLAKRVIIETTVAEKTSRRLLTAPLIHPDGTTHRNGQYWFRCGKEVLARYAVGDPIEIIFRYKKAIGGKGKWDYPTIVKRKPYAVERMHELTGYDA
jgi:hypothetical protein